MESKRGIITKISDKISVIKYNNEKGYDIQFSVDGLYEPNRLFESYTITEDEAASLIKAMQKA